MPPGELKPANPRGGRQGGSSKPGVLSSNQRGTSRPVPKRIAPPGFGHHLQTWRNRRRLTQMELAFRANVSARHLGFVELGRAAPSRALILRLADQLEVPLRERNLWLTSAGFAPVYGTRALDDPAFSEVRAAIELTLAAHRPYPAFAIDRQWNVIASNDALPVLYEGVADFLLQAPVNLLRLSLHPQGLAPRIVNLPAWSAHVLHRLRRESELTGDPQLAVMLREAEEYGLPTADSFEVSPADLIILPLRLSTRLGVFSFFSTITVFGTATDVVLSEIALEVVYPTDQATRDLVARAEAETSFKARSPIELAPPPGND